jgi:threonyl-tRNA synthetase
LGSKERMIALILERYKGIPFLLAEEQVKILLVDDRAIAFASDVKQSLEEIGFRVSLKPWSEKENESFRKRFLEKNQFLLILGEKETDLSMMRVRDPLSRSDEFLTLDKLILRLNRHLELESSSELQN